jgi:diacylglycerol kinase family enzyme
VVLVQARLVVNPFATRVSDAKLAAVEAELRRVAELTVVRTQHRLHASELVSEACHDGCDAVIVFSGDGGFNEALNGLHADVPIGFLPGGGTSVLPRALGLPADPVAAARRLAARFRNLADYVDLGYRERHDLADVGQRIGAGTIAYVPSLPHDVVDFSALDAVAQHLFGEATDGGD